MRPDKPLRPDTGEVSTATVLKVLGNRALSSRFHFKPLTKNHSGITDQNGIKPIVKGVKNNLVKPAASLRFNSPMGDDRDRRKLVEALKEVIDRKDDRPPAKKS